jgi:cholesterol oxidase
MKERFDAVVIGTGFGGAVSACRLAQAGLDVAVLERGRRYPLGSFPRNPHDLDDGWLWSRGAGLFDARSLDDVMIVQAAGYGGGSLVYANVQYRPPPEVFDQGWPAGYSRDALDPYYDLGAYMLDVTPVSAGQPNGLPPKTVLMRDVAAQLGRSDQFFLPNLAVNFDEPGHPKPNKFGVPQSGCTHCGECDVGCNLHAKNTLDLNYLAVAEAHGATVATLCEVTHISQVGNDYAVHFHDHDSGADTTITAPDVFVCAGAVNSTELLLRSRDRHRTLPHLSERLGAGYSANGDFLAFAFDTGPTAYQPSNGPTITTGLVYDDRSPTNRSWFVFEDGGFPQFAAVLLQLLGGRHVPGIVEELIGDEVRDVIGDRVNGIADQLATEDERSAVFLVMGRDGADGTIELCGGEWLRIKWKVPANLPLYVVESALCNDISEAMGGRYVQNPGWKYLGRPVSVHNLGGCRMAESPAEGVVDPDGEVFGYPGLHVIDGSIIPVATGANPSATITAVAERCIEQAIRRITHDAAWSAPERADATTPALPEDGITIPTGGTLRPRTQLVGVCFTETMQGDLTLPSEPEPQVLPARFRVTIASSDLALFMQDRTHSATADGTVWVDGFTGPKGAAIVGGVFNLFTDTDNLYRRNMLYHLPFSGADGRPYILQGYKEVWDHGHFDVWRSTTTLYTSLVDRDAPEGAEPLATGVLRLDLPMFVRQLSTMRITGTRNPVTQVVDLTNFARFFVGTLTDVFVRSKLDA